jgi:hypothetical protein
VSALTPPLAGATPLVDARGWRVALGSDLDRARAALAADEAVLARRAGLWRALLADPAALLAETARAEARVLRLAQLELVAVGNGLSTERPGETAEAGAFAAALAELEESFGGLVVESRRGDDMIGRSRLALGACATAWAGPADEDWRALHLRALGLVSAGLSLRVETLAATAGAADLLAASGEGLTAEQYADLILTRVEGRVAN